MQNYILCILLSWIAGSYIDPDVAQTILGITVGAVLGISFFLLYHYPALVPAVQPIPLRNHGFGSLAVGAA